MLKRPLRRGYPHPKRIETDVWEELVAVVSLAVHDLILLPTDQRHYRYTRVKYRNICLVSCPDAPSQNQILLFV